MLLRFAPEAIAERKAEYLWSEFSDYESVANACCNLVNGLKNESYESSVSILGNDRFSHLIPEELLELNPLYIWVSEDRVIVKFYSSLDTGVKFEFFDSGGCGSENDRSELWLFSTRHGSKLVFP